MSDNKSKAEKLAEGKKKLKKFQSKNKGKSPQDGAQEQDGYVGQEEATVSESDQRSEENFPQIPTTSSLFGGSAAADLPSFPTAEATSPDSPAAASISNLQPSFDQVQFFQSQTLNNFSHLSQKFDNLEEELGRSLSTGLNTTSSQMYESQIQELTQKLTEERQSNQNLEVRLREQYSNVDDLTMKLQRVELGSVSKVQTELGPLKDQLDNQIRTVALLVGEKAELSANLAAVESLAKSKDLENAELHAKLGASRHQVQKLKEELAALKKSQEKYDSSQQNLCTEVETTRDELKSLRRSNDDLKEEILELRRKLELKEIDFNALQLNHKEKLQEMDCLHLRLTQLCADDDPLQRDRMIEATAQQKIALEAQIQELLQQVEKANLDRDTAATHYQNYVQQLNKERETWIQKVQEITKERDELTQRDQQMVHHIGELEKQMQQQRSVQAKISQPESGNDEEKVITTVTGGSNHKELEEKIVKLENDLEVVQVKLSEERGNVQKISELLRTREEQVEQLEREAERLRNSHVDPQQISATLESEKVAASRAMTQNQQLRAQLEEMQTAFVQMTNDKANLMTELDAERYLGREMRSKYEEWDQEVKTLRQKLHFKDEEMIRLAHESTEQAKSILVLQQELDQMRHLEVNTRNQSHLQTEIVKQREQIAKLQAMIKLKETEAKQMNGGEGEDGEERTTLPVNGVKLEDGANPMEVSVAEEVGEELKTEAALIANQEIIPESVEVQELATGEAIVKLQERFTRTMHEIAELTEEKQRLEHLVIQLQGETETIGEYIALYQNQRKLLRQREIEKDIQVQRIEADREEMKEKLLKLNSLVEQMLAQRNINVQQVAMNGEQQEHIHGGDGGAPVAELAPGTMANDVIANKDSTAASRETAEQILDLLTEIKTQNTNFLTESMPTTCSCCSGQLQTV